MKRVTTLLMAAVMLIGFADLAGAAVEFKASGHLQTFMGVADNTLATGFNKDAAEDNFYAGQRFRPKLTMAAEGVTAVFEVQQQAYWGSDWPVGGNPAASVHIRQAYVDFKLPSTPVSLKVGYQQLNLPSIWGHPVFEGRVGGALATIPFSDQVALSVFWARPSDKLSMSEDYNDDVTDPASVSTASVTADPRHNSFDMFGAMLPLDFGSVKAVPYIVYARVGKVGYTVDDTAGAPYPYTGYSWNDTLIVGGVNLEIMPMDALSIKVDGIVTNHKSDAPSDFTATEAKTGFMLAAAVDYTMPWGTPGVFAWYATGEDKDGEGGLTVVSTDGFGATSWGFEGYTTMDLGAQVGTSGRSTAAVGAQIADISFVESLTHTVRLAYIMGTSDDSRAGTYEAWTTEDSFIEANLDSTWAIYQNLSAVVELGALLPDLGSETKQAGFDDDLVLRAQLTFNFRF